MPNLSRPTRDEAAEYYFTYIDKAADGDIRHILAAQLSESLAFFRTVTEEQSQARKNAEQWTGRQVLNHINDGERLFVFRAMWFARGFDIPLPSFDQNVAVVGAQPDLLPWSRHVEEFRTVREATITFFNNLSDEAWTRQGIASDYRFTVKALAYIIAGHLEHHVRIMRGRYTM